MAYSTATLTGKYETFDGQPASGVVEIIPNSRQLVDPEGDVILSGRVKVTLDETGAFSVTLPATDDATVEPATGRQYTVVAKLRHTHLAAVTGVELDTGATVDVADLASAPVVDPLVSTAATTAQLDALEASLSPVATSGAYSDLTGAPTIPATAADVGAEPAGTTAALDASLAPVAKSGAYSDLTAKPTIPTTAADVNALPDTTTAADIGAQPAATLDADTAARVNDTASQTHAALSSTYASRPPAPESPLNLPTPDGDPNVAHPSVVHIAGGWNGYRYWMAFTPFPDEARENPCVVASNDKVTWVVPAGAANPITALESINAEGWWYNSDTELVYDETSDSLVLYERVVNELDEAIRRRVSTDGATWSAPVEVVHLTIAAAGGDRKALSPTVVIEDDGTWAMWSVNRTLAKELRVERRTSADGITWTAPASITSPIGPRTPQADPWHIHACRAGGRYHMLVNTAWSAGSLLYWVSDDGITWKTGGPLVLRSGRNMDASGFYRSAIVPATTGGDVRFDLYVTMLDGTSATVQTDNQFRIALIENVSMRDGVRGKSRRPIAYLPAPVFWSGYNAPASGAVDGWQAWLMPAGTETGISTALSLRGHERVRVKVIWFNTQATAGNVSFQAQSRQYADGDSFGVGYSYTDEKADVPAGGQYVIKVTDLGLLAVVPGKTGEGVDAVKLEIHRRTWHNTLANDIAILAVMIELP